MSERVRIFDTTLRDGEQSAGVCFQPEDKVEIASLLAEMGVDVIEAGFPASSAGERRAVAQVARSVRGTVICGLARAVLDDVEAAAEALADAEAPRIHVFVNASDMQIDRQLRKSRRDVVGMVDAAVRRARRATDDVEFSPMDATRADPEFLAEVVRTALAAGATTINIPDTVGYILPVKLEQLFRDLRRRVPEVEGAVLSFHGQDDLGLATANAVAAVGAGARQIEVAVNGIGERAGNTAFEEVVMALRIHGEALGVHTGVDPEGIYRVSRCVEDRSGMPVPPNKPIVGRNAFRHASGIHQDGVLKWRETYELIDPKTIGHPTGTEIVLGKLSGRAGFAERARQLGFALDEAGLDRAFVRFQSVAETQRAVGDEEVMAICRGAAA
ncbi:MAG: 2-isopropylmalate synthase [Proteobacteria bacterium]|nr:2-isopropylmalate synthase [Pseudomonadota bacterium]